MLYYYFVLRIFGFIDWLLRSYRFILRHGYNLTKYDHLRNYTVGQYFCLFLSLCNEKGYKCMIGRDYLFIYILNH